MNNDNNEYPFLYSYVSDNLPYKYTNFNSITTDAKSSYGGLNDINNNYRYVLWSQSNSGQRYPLLMSRQSMEMMSRKITQKLNGVHPEGKNIIVPIETIRSVADSMFENNPMDTYVLRRMIVSHIVNSIKNEFEQIQNNNKLSLWITKYDVDSGLKRTNSIKLNQKQRSSYSFMKY
jgi:hypothetical protein